MRFDDRLRTVLAQPASNSHDRAVRWRQLVELVARAGADSDRALIDQAVAEIRDQIPVIDERVRSAAALAVAHSGVTVGLAAAFAADQLSVAAPILASARLTAAEWKVVAVAASPECKAFIATMNGGQQRQAGAASEQEAPAGPVPSISDVVARIERLRRSREAESDEAQSPPGGEPPRLFRWECNEAGEIDWVDGAPRGPLVGRSIAQGSPDGGVDRSVERAFASRAPFHAGVLELAGAGAVCGTWKISGIPAFDRANGRFAGYRGVAERAEDAAAAAGQAVDPASLRELAHEIKTPLNAIIGFAEIITGEYLGPANSAYRERAGEIVAQARQLLDAVEDLDFAARLRSQDGTAFADFADCMARSWDELLRHADARGVTISVTGEGVARCALNPQLAQRLVERMGIAVIDCASDGEALGFEIGGNAGSCFISVNLPASLKRLDLRSDRTRRAADGLALPLRLVMGLARTAGGDLSTANGRLILRVPAA